jgi:ABC-type branched-subunit amino acid transport system substrate-binding protein
MRQRISKALLPAALAALVLGMASPAGAAGNYDTGATDTSIKLGQTFPYSGPASGATPIARAIRGYFAWLNDQGGINGRKVDLVSLDDGYSPPKTVEQTRRLVEEDGVLAMFGSLGTPTGEAARNYLNAKKVPQLFQISGSSSLVDPKRYPWTMLGIPSYAAEGRIYAKYILAEKPDAKIGILYQDDDFGRDHLEAFLAELGSRAANMVVAKVSYQITDPMLTSQMITLKSSGADALYLITQGRPAPQSVTEVRALDWNPLVLLPSVDTSKGIIGPAGDEALKGVISSGYEKDGANPTLQDDPAVKAYLAWMRKYVPEADWKSDESSPAGYDLGAMMADVLRRCGDDLTRANLLNQATSINGFRMPMMLPGLSVKTSPTNYFPLRGLQMERYDGERWVPIGKPVEG